MKKNDTLSLLWSHLRIMNVDLNKIKKSILDLNTYPYDEEEINSILKLNLNEASLLQLRHSNIEDHVSSFYLDVFGDGTADIRNSLDENPSKEFTNKYDEIIKKFHMASVAMWTAINNCSQELKKIKNPLLTDISSINEEMKYLKNKESLS